MGGKPIGKRPSIALSVVLTSSIPIIILNQDVADLHRYEGLSKSQMISIVRRRSRQWAALQRSVAR